MFHNYTRHAISDDIDIYTRKIEKQESAFDCGQSGTYERFMMSKTLCALHLPRECPAAVTFWTLFLAIVVFTAAKTSLAVLTNIKLQKYFRKRTPALLGMFVEETAMNLHIRGDPWEQSRIGALWDCC